MSEYKNEPADPKESLFNCVVFDSRDWSLEKTDAWIYGIIVGWDEASLESLKNKFRWDDKTVQRLKSLNETWNTGAAEQ